jgi:hypothetical protein
MPKFRAQMAQSQVSQRQNVPQTRMDYSAGLNSQRATNHRGRLSGGGSPCYQSSWATIALMLLEHGLVSATVYAEVSVLRPHAYSLKVYSAISPLGGGGGGGMMKSEKRGTKNLIMRKRRQGSLE